MNQNEDIGVKEYHREMLETGNFYGISKLFDWRYTQLRCLDPSGWAVARLLCYEEVLASGALFDNLFQ